MGDQLRLKVYFFKTHAGKEPVRDWLRSLPRSEKKIIGEDIKIVQFGWPLGMPLVRKLDAGLWEVRSVINKGVSRIIFATIRKK